MTDRNVPPSAGRREWIGLAVLVLPTVLISVDMSVLFLAVPKLSADLRPTSVELLWITDIYGFLIAGSLITMGTIGDRIGRRKLLLIGAAAFGVASAIAAYAPTAELLIAARALLGIAGATLMPSSMSLIRNMFHDEKQRTLAFGLWMTGFSGGTVIGPLVGGLLLEHFWWGSVFLVGVPAMIVLLVLGPLFLPEYKATTTGRVDLPSAALSLVAMLGVVYGLKRLATEGVALVPLLAVVAGVGLAVVFARRQLRLADPLLDLRMFANRSFSSALGAMMLVIFVGPGIAFVISQYLQLVAGLSPLQAGLWSLPPAGAIVVGFLVAPLLIRWIPKAYVTGVGLALGAAGLLLITQVDVGSGPLLPVLAQVTFFLGASPMIVLGTELVVGSAPPERVGSAAAISETGQELGGALGIAVLGGVAAAVYAASGPAGTLANALASDLGAAAVRTAREAFVDGFQAIGVLSAAMIAGAAVIAVLLLRHQHVDGNDHEPKFESVES